MHLELFSTPFQPVSKRDMIAHHSRSLYIIVKKTCKNRFTALINTANRYSHASPDIIFAGVQLFLATCDLVYCLGSAKWSKDLD